MYESDNGEKDEKFASGKTTSFEDVNQQVICNIKEVCEKKVLLLL